ncbi:Pyruvate dehydrogenase E1 component [compost metagenome]
MDIMRLQRTRHTGQAAAACIHGIEVSAKPTHSPRQAVLNIVDALRRNPQTCNQFWLIDDRADPQQPLTSISAWPLWFSENSRYDERPLLYLTQSCTSAHLEMLTTQTADRGIILNDIESSPSRWAKGAHPWLPLWLAVNRHCMPFDPACAAEAQAIVTGALRELYLEGRPGFCYLTLHDSSVESLECDRSAAYRGMYRLAGAELPQVRLLAAGRMLEEVQAAARQLEQDWGIRSVVWSCPSYTRLARDATAVQQWNRHNRLHAARRSHLAECLGSTEAPVVAVTGYAEFVAAQLAPHVNAPFTALGADTLSAGQRLTRDWITYIALRSLTVQGTFAREDLGQVLEHYGLGSA